MRTINAVQATILAVTLLAPAVFARSPHIRIGDQKLYLAYAPEESANQLREYLPLGENFNRWQHLASIREFAQLDDPAKYLVMMAKTIPQTSPGGRAQLLKSRRTHELILDFVVYSDATDAEPYVEWNLMKATFVQGRGVVLYQYATRIYGRDKEAETLAIDAARQKLLPAFQEASFEENLIE